MSDINWAAIAECACPGCAGRYSGHPLNARPEREPAITPDQTRVKE